MFLALTCLLVSIFDSVATVCSVFDFAFLVFCVFVWAYDIYLPMDDFLKLFNTVVT